MSELPAQPRLNRRFRMQWEEVQGCHVLLYPEGMVKLNASASAILKRCDGSRTLEQIVQDIEAEFQTTGLKNDIVEMLRIAFEKDWIQ
ncbi:MAG: pyrroloquinoline quinone biosynthesis peptide chaperone PqqD [Burkholderiaceae bacterium]